MSAHHIKRLVIMRHAKSDWPGGVADHAGLGGVVQQGDESLRGRRLDRRRQPTHGRRADAGIAGLVPLDEADHRLERFRVVTIAG